MFERFTVILHCRQYHFTVGLEGLGGPLECIAGLLHRRQHYVAVGLERLGGMLEYPAALLRCRERELTVGLEGLVGIFEHIAVPRFCLRLHDLSVVLEGIGVKHDRVSFILHRREYHLTVGLEGLGGMLE